jgi:hypothetical protein
MPGDQPPVDLVGAVGGEDLAGGLLQRAAELGGPSAAVGQRLEVSEQMTLMPSSA